MLVTASPTPARPRGLIGIPRRSTFEPDRAIQIAAMAARGNIHPCPVIHGGKMLGMIRGEDFYSPRVVFKPTPYRMNYADYDDLVAEFVQRGKFYQSFSHKTLNGTGVAFSWWDMFTAGLVAPAYSLAGAAATAIAFDDTNASAMAHGGNVAPDAKYLLSASAQVGQGSCIMIYDRVLNYESCVYTAAANTVMTNVAVAARYATNGTPGCQLAWGADTVHDATASAITQLRYTNQAGTTLQLMQTTPAVDIVVSAQATASNTGTRLNAPAINGTTTPFGAFLPLAQTDTGARLVNDYTTSAANTGTFVLALVYPLAYVPVVLSAAATGMASVDQLFHISAMERVYDGACISFMIYQTVGGGFGASELGMTFGWG